MAFLVPLLALITVLGDPIPKEKDIKAGWTAFTLFLLLIAALVFLGFSLFKQLRKAQAAQEAGVYDGTPGESTDRPDNGDQQPS